jgi:hypothetical protein
LPHPPSVSFAEDYMNSEQQELWSKIREFDIDGGPAPFSFAKRLAKENGWSLAYANRVIEEYKRFVFLCMVSGHACSPSDQVDQAWHLHLTYTESYWTRFNQEVLPKQLHHGPTKGGTAESAKFADWYQRTLDSYERLFGTQAPSDIWTPPSIRAKSGEHWKRVDISKFLMIPKVSVTRGLAWSGAATLLGLGGWGCSYLVAETPAGILPLFIIFGVVVLILVIAGVAIANQSRNNSSGCSSSGCGSTHMSGCGSHGHGHGHGDGDGEGSGGGDGGGDSGGSSCGGGCGGGGD